MSSNAHRWSIVLSGGQGRRMGRWIERYAGERRPKQYCAFVGRRTMLQHTLARAVQVSPAAHTVTVIGHGHRRFIADDPDPGIPGAVIEQPEDHGTAAGVLLAAAYIRASDPHATVLILPSDHFIWPDSRFRAHAAFAVALADLLEDRFVLLAAVAEHAETDYGWILPGRDRSEAMVDMSGAIRSVVGFREKPGPEEARELFRAGGLWSTLVVAVRLRTLWNAARRLLPDLIDRFELLHRTVRAVRAGRLAPERETELLRDIYLDMPSADVSRDLLAHVAPASVVRAMGDVEWSDWGRPERVIETIRRIRGDAARATGARPESPEARPETSRTRRIVERAPLQGDPPAPWDDAAPRAGTSVA